jgi:hypothetical protein
MGFTALHLSRHTVAQVPAVAKVLACSGTKADMSTYFRLQKMKTYYLGKL